MKLPPEPPQSDSGADSPGSPPIPVIGGGGAPPGIPRSRSQPASGAVPAPEPVEASGDPDDATEAEATEEGAEGAFLVVTPTEAAALAGREGYAIFPLVPGAKRPAVGLRWPKASSDDPAMVERVFGAFSARAGGSGPKLAGVGIDCGKSNLVVVDVDGPITEELQAALDETPTLVWASAVRGGPHYVFAQRPDPAPRIGCPKLPGCDVKGDGGLVARSARPPIRVTDVAVIPDRLADMLTKAGTGGGEYGATALVTAPDLHDWLAAHEAQVPDSTAEGFLDRKVAEFVRKVEAGEHRREAVRDVSLGMTIEVAAGCYSGTEAFGRLRDVYRQSRTDDPKGRNVGPGAEAKGWTTERQRDHELLWRGALSRVLAGWYDEAITETAERAGVIGVDEWAEVTEVLEAAAEVVDVAAPDRVPEEEPPHKTHKTHKTPKETKAKKPKGKPKETKAQRAAARARSAIPSGMVSGGTVYPDGSPRMGPDAHYGPLARFAEQVASVSEAGFEPLMLTALAHWSVFCGGGWRIEAGGGFHTADVWAVIVAPSATVKGRSLRVTRPVFDYPEVPGAVVVPGDDAPLSEGLPASGEALIQVFTPPSGPVWVAGPGASRTTAALEALEASIVAVEADPDPDPEGEGEETDPVWPDPRVLFVDTEFGSALQRWRRGGSVLPHMLRQAHDRTPLSNRTVGRGREYVEPVAYHVGMLAHITPHELRDLLTVTDTLGGTTGRWLWGAADRRAVLPEGEPPGVVRGFREGLAAALWPTGVGPGMGPGGVVPHGVGPTRLGGRGVPVGGGAVTVSASWWGSMRRRRSCGGRRTPGWCRRTRRGLVRGRLRRVRWWTRSWPAPPGISPGWPWRCGSAPDLISGAGGGAGSEALWWGERWGEWGGDVAGVVPAEALAAAVAIWGYCEASVGWVFGARSGDAVFDRILAAVRAAGARGLAARDIRELSWRSTDYIARAIDLGLVSERVVRLGGGGRPQRRIIAVEWLDDGAGAGKGPVAGE